MGVPGEPPVFYPTKADMRGSFEAYIESIEDQIEEYGIARIVPPKGWQPRQGSYDDIDFTVPQPIKQHATGRKGLFRTLLVEGKPISIKHDFKPMATAKENLPPEAALKDKSQLEREFWKKVTYSPPTYCADVEGTLFDESNWGWDISKLDSLLSRTLKKRGLVVPGVSSAYLYFGMWRALFAWHTEDVDLYSVNYLHFGAPKYWYAIPPEHRKRFECVAQGLVPEMWRACPEFLRHKELLISPQLLQQHGIPFVRMMQHPGEFVITYPGSYHSGFNTGFNCAESTNFATRAWVEVGKEAGVCECMGNDAVRLDMSMFDGATSCSSPGPYAPQRMRRIAIATKRAAMEPAGDKDDNTGDAKCGVCRSGKSKGNDGSQRDAKRPKLTASGQVAVPKGWERWVTMRNCAPDAVHDRDTYYCAPCGKTMRTRPEVLRYLQENPREKCGIEDFYFETKEADDPARLFVPGTPSPTSSSAQGKRGMLGRAVSAKDQQQRGGSEGAAAVRSLRIRPMPAGAARGAPDKDRKAAAGVAKKQGRRGQSKAAAAKAKAKAAAAAAAALSAALSPAQAQAPQPSSQSPTSPGMKTVSLPASARAIAAQAVAEAAADPDAPVARAPRSRLERAAGAPVDDATLREWKSAGVLHSAVAKVLARQAAQGGKAMRGSSLMMQVEHALGVGKGALRDHSKVIQGMASRMA